MSARRWTIAVMVSATVGLLLASTARADETRTPSPSAAVTAATPAPASLYARMGGQPVIDRVVSQMIDQVSSDPTAGRSFHKVNLKRLKLKLGEEFCFLTGGGCAAPEDDVRTIHAGLGVNEGEFYRLVEILRQSLDDNAVPTREKNELLRILAPMKRDVVSR